MGNAINGILDRLGKAGKDVLVLIFGFLSSTAAMLIDKLRINVVIVAVLITWIIIDFGDKLINLLGDGEIPVEAIIATLALLIGTGIGGLITTMGRMFDGPSVPADTFERIMKLDLKRIDDKSTECRARRPH